jgi:uncharacterized protein YjbI with pentapeptide repeats
MIEYIVLETKELDYLLERHKLWLEQNGSQGKRLDMKKLDFRSYDLRNKNLSKAKLVSSNFSGLNLDNLNLSGANISKADFSNTTMTEVNFAGINAPNTNFQKSKIKNSNLRIGNFRTANFENAIVIESFLERTILNQAQLLNSDFSNTHLKMAKFKNANLINTNLSQTNLSQTNFISANLENANITGAIFWQVQNAYWNIKNINCDYLFIDEIGKQRLPSSGIFKNNEAEEYLSKIELAGIKQKNNGINYSSLEKTLNKHQLFMLTKGKEGERANLSNINFQEITLNNKDLRGALLDFTNFSDADLRWSTFKGSKLRNSKFDNAKLFKIDLEGANLRGSSLQQANLSEANLKYTKLSWSNLVGVSLKKACLINASIENSNLQRSDLSSANLSNANLRRSTLIRANLTNANLTNAYLSGCNFAGADLTNACITGAVLNATHTDGWKINNIDCDYIYFDKEGILRTPPHRNFEKGEFEELYSWFPSFIYYFKDSMHALDPYLISLIISSLNKTIKGLHLDIDEIKARGLTPQVVLSVKSEHSTLEIEQIVKNMFDDNLAILHKQFANIELAMTNNILPAIENSIKNTMKEFPMNKLEFNAPVGTVIAENNGTINIQSITKSEIIQIKDEIERIKTTKTFTQKMKDNMLSELSKAIIGEVSEISQNTLEWIKENASDFTISISDFLNKIN